MSDAPASMPWQADAACRDAPLDWFFPEVRGASTPGTAHARRLCDECEVAEECLAYAMENDLRNGIFGGTNHRERKRLKESAARE